MVAGTYDIVIDQGSDFSIQIQVQQNDANVNLSTHSARAQLRPTLTSNTKTADFTCTITDSANGILTMALGHGTTTNVTAGKYFYDLELVNTSANTVTRLIQGVARVTQEVTR